MQNKPNHNQTRNGTKVVPVPVPTRPRLSLKQSDAGGKFVRDAQGRNVAYVAGGK